MSRAVALVEGESDRWRRLAEHPFVLATADGTLEVGAFDRWLLEDHAFVVEFRRFLAGVLTLAPDERSRDVLAGGIAALTPELELFRVELDRRGLDRDGYRPSLGCASYTSFMMASLHDGYEVASVVLYGVEKAYLDAWTTVRERAAAADSRYRSFIDNWSAPPFASYVADLGELLGAGEPTARQRAAFGRVAEFEVAFWDECGALPPTPPAA
ncbi:transcriptional regulator [Rhodococcus spelaei]|uniref:Transcriptional regulator n=1 Tax=Rhodococcus spelaei TaxID=2546320 RepID=A0A541BLW6_9NOCA|nr:transcriptional regulator [Rhodococcus spelaei]TQF73308.1 transcriptional regulator [Rhodococcus spelaei]